MTVCYLCYNRHVVVSMLNESLPPSGGTHIRVLMFIDSMEVEGLVVDEELSAGNFDSANANW